MPGPRPSNNVYIRVCVLPGQSKFVWNDGKAGGTVYVRARILSRRTISSKNSSNDEERIEIVVVTAKSVEENALWLRGQNSGD